MFAIEPMPLNAVNFQTTCMSSADILPWHSDDDDPDPSCQNRECCVKWIRVNTSAINSDLYSELIFDDNVFEDPVFARDDMNVPNYDSPTKVNLVDVDTMHNYWSRDPDIITVNAVENNKDDHTAVRGQLDYGAYATVTNLLIN